MIFFWTAKSIYKPSCFFDSSGDLSSGSSEFLMGKRGFRLMFSLHQHIDGRELGMLETIACIRHPDSDWRAALIISLGNADGLPQMGIFCVFVLFKRELFDARTANMHLALPLGLA